MGSEAGQAQHRLGLDARVALAVGLGFLALYLRTLCPTVWFGDAGDFCTAIATGGVPHPPGYPLFSLLGRLALMLIPGGEPAFRIGCVVALAAAGAVAMLYLVAREAGGSPWAAATASALFGTTFTFWSQSVRVEVYSLHILLLGLTLFFGLRYRRTGRLQDLAALALSASLGLAHHLTIVLAAPAVLFLCGRRLWSEPGRVRRLAAVSLLLPIGPALYLLLLLWARRDPLHSWGHPVTLPLLWSHASARLYQSHLGLPSLPNLGARLREAAALYADNFPYLIGLLPLVGATLLYRRDRAIGGALALLLLTVCAYNCWYKIADIDGYYLPAWMVAAVLIAPALDALQQRGVLLRRWPAALAISLVLMGLLLQRNFAACDLSHATGMRDLARRKLESAPPGSILLTQSPDDTFPIWYVHDVLKVRPDVTPIDRLEVMYAWTLYQNDPSLWYLHRLRRQGVAAPLDAPRSAAGRMAQAQGAYLVRLLERELRGRPICTTFSLAFPQFVREQPVLSRWLQSRCVEVPLGLVLSLRPREQPIDLRDLLRENQRLWTGVDLPDIRHVRMDQELIPNFLEDQYGFMLGSLGHLYQMAGDRDRAEQIYRRVIEWAPDFTPAHLALARLARSRRS